MKSQLIRREPHAGKDWGQEGDNRGWDGCMADSLVGWLITDSMDMTLSKLQETVKDRKTWYAAVHGVTQSRTWLSDWTTAINLITEIDVLFSVASLDYIRIIQFSLYAWFFIFLCWRILFMYFVHSFVLPLCCFPFCLRWECPHRVWLSQVVPEYRLAGMTINSTYGRKKWCIWRADGDAGRSQ